MKHPDPQHDIQTPEQLQSLFDAPVETAFFQCARAVLRADLWNPEKHLPRSALPSTGKLLADAARKPFDGEAYDKDLTQRLRSTLY